MRRAWFPLLSVTALWPAVARAEPPEAEVRVVGERAALPRSTRDETPSSTVLDEARLRSAGGSLGDALRPVAGVVLSSSGSASDLATVSIRGATSSQLPVYLAGVRLNDDLTGTFDASTVPTWMLERVELFRGNAPPSGDRLGIAGALFLEPVRPRGTLARVSSTVGSFGARELAGLVAVGDGSASTFVAVRHHVASNDYPYTQDRGTLGTPDDDVTARRQNADATTTDAWTASRVTRGRLVASTLVHVFAREQGAPGQLLVPALHARLSTTRALGDGTVRLPCGETCGLAVGVSALRATTDVRDRRREIGLGSSQVYSEGRRLSPHARLASALRDDLDVSLDVSLARETVERTSGSAFRRTGDTRARRLSGHGSGQLVWDATPRLRASALAALDATETAETAGVSTTRAPLSARIGARYGDGDGAVLANVGRAVRLPTLGELFGQSALLGGNPELLPERALGADLGLRGTRLLGPVRLETQAFAFARLTDDLVVYERDSFLVFRPRNVKRSRTLGSDGTVSASLAGWLQAEQTLTVLSARDTSSGPFVFAGQLPFLPRTVSSSRLSVTPWRRADGAEVTASATLLRQGARFADRSGLVVIPSQTTLDVDARLRLPLAAVGEGILRARVDNVTSTRRVDVIGYPLPPRQLFVSLEITARTFVTAR